MLCFIQYRLYKYKSFFLYNMFFIANFLKRGTSLFVFDKYSISLQTEHTDKIKIL